MTERRAMAAAPRTFPHVVFSTWIFLLREMDVPCQRRKGHFSGRTGALGMASLLPTVPRTGNWPLCHASARPVAPGSVPFQYSRYVWLSSSYVIHRGSYFHFLH